MKRALIVLVILAAIIALFFLLRPRTREDVRVEAEAQKSEGAVEVEAREKIERATTKETSAPLQQQRPNSAIAPRVVLTPPKTPPREEPLHVAEARGLVDKRGIKSADTARELEALNYGMETLDDDIEECLEQWKSTSSTISGKAMVGFQISPDGLTSAWLEGGEQIPFGPRTCIANAVYGIDWSRIVDHPAEITRRFELDPTKDPTKDPAKER